MMWIGGSNSSFSPGLNHGDADAGSPAKGSSAQDL
jgi:hypothetical protein